VTNQDELNKQVLEIVKQITETEKIVARRIDALQKHLISQQTEIDELKKKIEEFEHLISKKFNKPTEFNLGR